MKLLFIRHGDPDYVNDSLTEKGMREAALLAERIAKTHIDEYFVSPLGRAQETARPCLERTGREAVTLDWLREFDPRIIRPDSPERTHVCWDWLPQDWTEREHFFRYDEWMDDETLNEGQVRESAQYVFDGMDSFLSTHGYERDKHYYRAVRPNNDTIAFFCHFGVTALILGHLIGASPMVLWHGFCAAPTSVTTVYTEERRPGIASFRIASYGDISHLYAADEPPAFSARFRECYMNEDERRD